MTWQTPPVDLASQVAFQLLLLPAAGADSAAIAPARLRPRLGSHSPHLLDKRGIMTCECPRLADASSVEARR